VQTPTGAKEKSITVKKGDDLATRSEGRASYQDGYQITAINGEPGNEHIQFNNGKTLQLGDEIGGVRDDVWRVQIKQTVKRHLENELKLQERGIKVLSLFFLDKVSNYRVYGDDGVVRKGPFALAFEEILAELAKEPRFLPLAWLKQSIDKLHDGYFAKDKSGSFKDSRGNTADDDDAYNLIMRDKERLLDPAEPLRFIFSHSALREGWDNPNVFQICTLATSTSGIKKRQEIGRGLRLPVDKDGLRVFDDTINRLYVMANESYESFAEGLQKEYETDCGVTFGKVPTTAIAKLTRITTGDDGNEEIQIGKAVAEQVRLALVASKMLDNDNRIGKAFDPKAKDFALNLPKELADLEPAVIDLLSSYQIQRHVTRDKDEGPNRLRKGIRMTPEFKALWDKIKPRTSYRVEFTTHDLVIRAVTAIKEMDKIQAPKITVTTGKLNVKRGGIEANILAVTDDSSASGSLPLPDILAYLQNETQLTRSTLVRILKDAGRLADVYANPQRYLDAVTKIIKSELHRVLVDGIKYERVQGAGSDAAWEMTSFESEEMINYLNAIAVNNSVYEFVTYESEVERQFAADLDAREDIKLFMKLPRWFVVETPVGKYNPDWAVVKQDESTVYLVRETKGSVDFEKLRTSEADKVRCGRKHFEALGVQFSVVVKANEV
jgi:type III restriction enzyme